MSTVKMESSDKLLPCIPSHCHEEEEINCFVLVILSCIWKLNAVLIQKGEPLAFGCCDLFYPIIR